MKKNMLCKISILIIFVLASINVKSQSSEAIQAYEEANKMLSSRVKSATQIRLLLEKAIQLSPTYSEAYFLLGRIASYPELNHDGAISLYEKAIQLSPNNPIYYYHLADEYSLKLQNELALTNYNEAIRLNLPIEYRIYEGQNIYKDRGGLLLKLKQTDGAIEDFTVAIEYDPRDYNLYLNRAMLFYKKKLFNLAIRDCLKGIEVMPKDVVKRVRAHFYFLLGEGYVAIGKQDLALKAHQEAINPGDYNTLLERGSRFEALNEYDWAIQDYSEAIKMQPNNSSAYGWRARTYIEMRKYDLALADYDKRIEMDKYALSLSDNDKRDEFNSKLYYGFIARGSFKKLTGNYQQSVKDFEDASSLKKADLNLYTSILAVSVRLGDFNKAKKYADSILLLPVPTDIGKKLFYINEGSFFFRDYVEAIHTSLPQRKYNEVLTKLNNSMAKYVPFSRGVIGLYTDVLALKGYVLEKLNRNQEALVVYNQTLLINPNQPDVIASIKRLTQKQSIVNIQDKTLPVIELISPQATRGLKIVKNETSIEIVGRAIDESGIKSIKVNGIALTKVEDDGLFITNVSLKEGLNKIMVIAVDKNNNTAIKTFDFNTTIQTITVKKDENEIIPVIADKPPVFYAILIGENDYQDPSIDDLSNPGKDALALKNILKTKYTFEEKNIETLLNKSREEIMQSIVLKSNTLTENDNLVIFYAGHGIAEKDKFGDVDGYWIPSSAKKGITSTYISSDDINKALKRSESKHILIIADACFSGAFTRSMSADAPKDIQTQYKYNSRKIMASGNMEPVPDNSKFIYYLNKNLQDNKLKYLTAKDLFNSFYKAVINNTDTLPQYAAIKNVGDEGGEFVFILR